MENGRLYHGFRRGLYMFPCDEVCTPRFCFPRLRALFAHTAQDEKDRMDIYHKIMEVARRGQLHQAPIFVNPNDPPRILDLGCGTGIWAIDMAE
jgi:hypothetical protein